MSNKKTEENRITIECDSCKRTFTKYVPKEERTGELIVRCPYGDCKIESKIVFDISDEVEIYKTRDKD